MMGGRIDAPARVARGGIGYPERLRRLGTDSPDELAVHGNAALLDDPIVALFSSVRIPGGAVVQAFDLARILAGSARTVAGGFQSPIEREMLDILLAGSASVIICPARGIEGLRIPTRWERPLAESRLLLLSPFQSKIRRPTSALADRRNAVVAATATRLLILHATPGGRLHRLAREAIGWGLPIQCLDHPANEDLRLLGARTISLPPFSVP